MAFGISAATWAATAAVGSVAVGAVSAYNQAGQAEDALALSARQGDTQAALALREADLAKEKWDLYKDKVFPMEQEAQRLGVDARELAQQRGELDFQLYEDYYAPLQIDFVGEAMEGVQPQVERVTREAGEAVEREFGREEGMLKRDLERRGIKPDSGAFRGIQRAGGLQKAAARASEMTTAKERELDRAEDVSFSRKATALGRQPGAISPSQGGSTSVTGSAGTGGAGSAASAFGSMAARSADQASQYATGAGETMRGGMNLASQIYDKWGGGGGGGGYVPYADAGSIPGGFAGTGPQTGYQNPAGYTYDPASIGFADGGKVPYADGGKVPALSRGGPGGQVNGPAGVDQVPGTIESPDGQTADVRLSGGEMVIPKDVVDFKGTDFFDKMIEKHHRPVAPQAALSRRVS